MKRQHRRHGDDREEEDAAPPLRRPGGDASSTEASLSLVPTPLVREHVFSFLVAPALLADEEFCVAQHRAAHEQQLLRLGAVCRAWHAAVASIKQENFTLSHYIHFQRGNAEERDRQLALAQQHGATAKVLHLSMRRDTDWDAFCDPFSDVDVETTTGSVFWLSLLSKFQQIERLELSLVPSDVAREIVHAASRTCLSIRALVLPYEPPGNVIDDADEETRVVVEAMRRWHSSNGGLRLLHVPFWPRAQQKQLLDAIVLLCPKIRYLRGWHGHSKGRDVTVLATADTSSWAVFCETCTELREFDWVQAPMWGFYVDAFCSTTKPDLEKLVARETRSRPDVRKGVRTVERMLAVVPRLRSLEVEMRDRMFFLIAENHLAYAETVVTLADSFIVSLVHQCPLLQELSYRMRSSDREVTITSNAIVALLALPSVRHLEMTRVVFEATSLTLLLQTIRAHAPRRDRELRVSLTAADSAHDSILALVQHVGTSKCTMDGLRLSLKVTREDMVKNTYPRGILVKNLISEDELQRLIHAIKAAHADAHMSLRLHVLCFGVDTQRLAFGEVELVVDGTTPVGQGEEDLTEQCDVDIIRTQLPRYKRKGGRIA